MMKKINQNYEEQKLDNTVPRFLQRGIRDAER